MCGYGGTPTRKRVPQLRGLNLQTLRSSALVGRIIPDAPVQHPKPQATFAT
jgi:hypothetical protein